MKEVKFILLQNLGAAEHVKQGKQVPARDGTHAAAKDDRTTEHEGRKDASVHRRADRQVSAVAVALHRGVPVFTFDFPASMAVDAFLAR